MKSFEHYSHWEKHNGKKVYLDGLAYTIQVNVYRTIYPYESNSITVYANPVNHNSEHYLAVKDKLGDDWSTDVLASSLEVQCEIEKQCNARVREIN